MLKKANQKKSRHLLVRGLGFAAALLWFTVGGEVPARDSRLVTYDAAPSWVAPAPQPTESSVSPGAPYRVIYSDTQELAAIGGTETYVNYKVEILRPEALSLGNLTLSWLQGRGSATVHGLKIVRDGKVIDVLTTNKFRVIDQEQNLDQARLAGILTAVLQVPGLQVGDTLEFSATITRHEPALGNVAFGVWQLPVIGSKGVFRYRILWPVGQHLNWQTSKDLPTPAVQTANGFNNISIELRDPAGSVPTDGAPARYNLRRVLEYSSFDGWEDLSRRIYALFNEASTLGPGSPVEAEIERIRMATADPEIRVQMALSLVQDRIRYVYVGLDGGNYRPVNADETWDQKFGDCKAKTALLLAILRGLGIEAEAVLVNSNGGDGLNEWLASPGLFDHVLVRAHIGSKVYWLDATRSGDTHLDHIPPPLYRWVLPVTAEGSQIEALVPQALKVPQSIEQIDIDARAGFDVPAKVTKRVYLHGDAAKMMKFQSEAMSHEDALQAFKSAAVGGVWDELDAIDWEYDEAENVFIFTMKGTWSLDWSGDQESGRSYSLPGAGFYPPDERHRIKEQDQDAPWVRDSFPKFTCFATTVHLPAASNGMAWNYEAEPMNRRLGGQAYWRASGLKSNVVRTVMSSNIYLPEITSAEAKAVNKAIKGFNNNISSVFEAEAEDTPVADPLPFGDNPNWEELVKACTPN